MRGGIVRRALGLALLLGLAAAWPRTALAQQARINGLISDSVTGAGLEGARVMLVGTSLIEVTDRDGRYGFRSVASGNYQLRVLRVGYEPQLRTVAVAPGETGELNFALTPSAIQLDEIVVTASGEQRKLEVSNSSVTIDAAKVTAEAPITEIGNLISGRAAGVQVLKTGGTTGTGTRIRIRGSNSVSLSNEPLYYIDGIRMESNPSSLSLDVGGGIPGGKTSRINDLNPDDIESIEIVKGPAAATLYGIQASNGVVRITTKRGAAGRPRWNLFVEQGAVDDRNTYPINWTGKDNTGSGYDNYCIVQYELDGLCSQTSVQQFQPLNFGATRPYRAGLRQQYGANVSGGTDNVTYYVSGEYENEQGVYRLPQAEEDSIRALRGDVAANVLRPNALEKVSVRSNIRARVATNADITANVGFVTSNIRVPENDNSFLTIVGSGEASGYPKDINRGWYYIPAQLFAELSNQKVDRITTGLTGNWQPNRWLSTRLTLGYDLTQSNDKQFFPTGQVADYIDNLQGRLVNNRFTQSQMSVDLGASARFQLNPRWSSKTSVGGQFFRDLTTGLLAEGRGLAPGVETITGAKNTEASDTTLESRSIGSYVEQEFGLNQRLFVTGALRFDDNSAFGKNFNATSYPKGGVSWLVSEEPFFHVPWLNTFRLRAAMGASGQQPGSLDALTFYSPTAGKKNNVPTTGITFGNLGNGNLKPERSREIEAGLDAGLFDGRVTVEFTLYSKKTTDALILRDIPGSVGTTQSQFFNLGEVSNKGAELAINARIIESPTLVWDLTLSGSRTKNKLIKLGNGVEPIIFGFGQQRHVEGFPLGGYWARPYTYQDLNGDGIIDGRLGSPELVVADSAKYVGSGMPTREASLNTSLTLFNSRIRLGGQFDYRGGHIIDNAIESFRCSPVLNCRGLVDRTAPLKEQAAAQAVLNYADEYGYYEPAWFIKLRELSLTFYAPDGWARMFGASRLNLTVSGRNLWTITDYSGVDPEVNAFGQANFSLSDFESQPQVTYWLARVNVGF